MVLLSSWKEGGILKLPNGYGAIVKLNGNRRKPFQVRITKGFTDERKANIYVSRVLFKTR